MATSSDVFKQLSPSLPELHTYLTGHDASTRKAIIKERRDAKWTKYDDKSMAFHVAYTTSEFPVSLTSDADIATHDKVLASGKLGLVNPGGTVCRVVDFAPGFDCMMHRTQSLDFGVVLEGSIELLLDSGETQLMRRGDIAVQRVTNHAWRNPSQTEWARMMFVLQDCQELILGGKAMGEMFERPVKGLPHSGSI